MKRTGFFLLLYGLWFLPGWSLAQPREVELITNETEYRIDVKIGGRDFTSYRFGPEFKMKPVFYPVNSPDGIRVVREIPFHNEELQKSQDHPHHQSVYFGYGSVDGLDFWSHHNGERIIHRSISETVPNGFTFLADWIDRTGRTLVHELRRMRFGGTEDCYWMDHEIKLTAFEDRSFADTKEGLFAIRVAEALREDRGSGRYLNAYGWETAERIWGRRAPWVALFGEVEGQPVTIAIFDHPSTENHPSYWHARAYGLFSVNPFGRKDFMKGSEPINSVLKANQTFHFRYRLLVYRGRVDKERLERDYRQFAQ